MEIAQHKDRVIFAIIILLAFFIGYNLIYRLAQEKINSLDVRIKAETKKKDILKTIAVIDKKLETYQCRALASTEITQLVDILSKLAKQAGVEINSFDPKTTTSRKQYIEVPLRMPMRSTYHSLGQFLSLVESNDELIWVKELKVNKPEVSVGRKGRALSRDPKVELTVSGFYFKQ